MTTINNKGNPSSSEQREGSAKVEAEASAASTKEHDKLIRFFLDGEEETTTDRELTPNFIIQKFGHKDPATHYLLRIGGGKKENFKGAGTTPIKLHNNESFQIISLGPTEVSDGSSNKGVTCFVQGLLDLGYQPRALPNHPDHVIIDYPIEVGKYAGTTVRLGFQVPPDFPLSPPGGPHVSPRIHPFNQPGGHPHGAVHHEHAKPFEAGAGGEWQYWSRPFPNWNGAKKTVASYMAHIWRLWETQ